jgi:glycine cleavage system transcriptional repressor
LNKVFISVIGRDRPGILAALSRVLLEQDCNIENISQTILQSVFGALMIVSVPGHLDEQSLKSKILNNLPDLDLDIFVKDYDSVVADENRTHSHPFVITTLGPDKPGLVNVITSVFAKYDINVTNLKAVFKGGKDPRDNVMIFEVDIPDQIALPEIRIALQQAAQKLDLDINVQHRKIFETMNRI